MSYFMTLSGNIPRSAPRVGVEYIPVSVAQAYVARLENDLIKLDGAPVYLVHDMVTGTSDVIVGDLMNAIVAGEDWSELPLSKLLQACFSSATSFRIWLANDDPNAHANTSSEVTSFDAALPMLEAWRGVWWHAPANSSFKTDGPCGPAA